MSEKRLPTHDLERIKRAARSESRLAVTGSAIRSATALGFDRAEMMEVVSGMSRQHFYKSMTSYGDHRTWHDVYHVPSRAGVLYVKFTEGVVTEFLLLSFKRRDDER